MSDRTAKAWRMTVAVLVLPVLAACTESYDRSGCGRIVAQWTSENVYLAVARDIRSVKGGWEVSNFIEIQPSQFRGDPTFIPEHAVRLIAFDVDQCPDSNEPA